MNSRFPQDPIKKLIAIMSHLRSPQGCPWDQQQTPDSMKPYLLEEAYEVLAALDKGDTDEIKKELGDLLLQIIFLADIFSDDGTFNFDSVAESISEKLIRRHPHVFGDIQEEDLDKLNQQWDTIKKTEQTGDESSYINQQHSALPALLQAQKISSKVARVGFDWSNAQEVLDQLEEEVRELKSAIAAQDQESISNEIGDILFTVTNLGRHLEVDCETALLTMIDRFAARFNHMEQLADRNQVQMNQLTIDELNHYWQQAKLLEPFKS